MSQLPIVWESFLPDAQADFAVEQKKYEKAFRTYQSELRGWDEQQMLVTSAAQSSSQPTTPIQSRKGKKPLYNPKPVPPVPPQPRMQADEVSMFLALSTALKIYLGCQVTDNSINRASALFHDYLVTYRRVSRSYNISVFLPNCCLQLYGENAMKPNHHYAVHMPDQLRDFGPVYEFWTFLTERLNKVLKSYNSNSWTRGHLEISMMRAFDREVRVHTMVSITLSSSIY
jgi:hypothetical protein